MTEKISFCGYRCELCAARSDDPEVRQRLVDGWRKYLGHQHVSHFLDDQLSMEAIISNLAIAILWGLIGCYVYWRSRNLLFAVVLHAPINAPTLCYGAGALEEMTMFAVTNLLAILLTEIWVRLATNPTAVRQQPFPSPNA